MHEATDYLVFGRQHNTCRKMGIVQGVSNWKSLNGECTLKSLISLKNSNETVI